jgi:ABC-type transporter MlaC component
MFIRNIYKYLLICLAVNVLLGDTSFASSITSSDLKKSKENTTKLLSIAKSLQEEIEAGKMKSDVLIKNKNIIKNMIDIEAFINSSVGMHKPKLGKNYQEIRSILREVFENVFQHNLGGNLKGAEIDMQNPTIGSGETYTENGEIVNKEWVEVNNNIYIEEEDMELDIALCWSKNQKVIDILFDDTSLVLDYRNQFAKFLKVHQDGGEKLKETLQKKSDEFKKKINKK